ncbi:lysophospholipase [Staphylococcus gallinarum]|uniref:alpha/beta fold hydrolase n=1 Tax=Staphylococcus TaxID=1279 RepID=UPI000D1C7E87|nr:alpha/beta fold hydrolase [Staphylococcus gallinarum]MCD8825706.1 lysophospholipase [Staphylococcus gallinarum]MCQ9287803.1 lysophospholipase [Staphylococcus gallinarum]PTE79711.1 lysophospholipase [Staphylococcus gallinarum]
MNLKEFKITVSDGKMIDVKLDKAKQQTIGVIHLFHGMADHMDRYDRLVASLNQQGYDVLRHNHRGHGISIADNERGHFDSIEQLAEDAYEIAQTVCTNYNNIPYIVIGHSMGSIVARVFSEKYPLSLQGLILTGTLQHNKGMGLLLSSLLKLITIICGKRRKLKWLNNLMNRTFNKKIDAQLTEFDWISSTDSEVEAYNNDPNAGYLVSNQIIYDTMRQARRTSKIKNIKQMNQNLPVLLISGKEDALGNYGEGIRQLGKYYKKGGLNHVTIQLYKFKRHEILFEEGYTQTWQHMYEWIEKQILKKYDNTK